ncbi:hypothetical protein ACFQ60_39570 [Streptomyces zhihengii]
MIPEFSTEHQDAFVLYDGVAADQDAFCDRVAADLAATPLDPERSPGIVLRCQPGADGVFLHLAASHAIIDGTQFSEILTQVGQVYAGGTELPGLPARAPSTRPRATATAPSGARPSPGSPAGPWTKPSAGRSSTAAGEGGGSAGDCPPTGSTP